MRQRSRRTRALRARRPRRRKRAAARRRRRQADRALRSGKRWRRRSRTATCWRGKARAWPCCFPTVRPSRRSQASCSACEGGAADTESWSASPTTRPNDWQEESRRSAARRRRGGPEIARAHHVLSRGGGSGHRGPAVAAQSRTSSRRTTASCRRRSDCQDLVARARPADGRGLPRLHRPRGPRRIAEAQGQRARVGEARLLHVPKDLREDWCMLRRHGGRQRRRRTTGHCRGHDVG